MFEGPVERSYEGQLQLRQSDLQLGLKNSPMSYPQWMSLLLLSC
jgi:hypothetical protein